MEENGRDKPVYPLALLQSVLRFYCTSFSLFFFPLFSLPSLVTPILLSVFMVDLTIISRFHYFPFFHSLSSLFISHFLLFSMVYTIKFICYINSTQSQSFIPPPFYSRRLFSRFIGLFTCLPGFYSPISRSLWWPALSSD